MGVSLSTPTGGGKKGGGQSNIPIPNFGPMLQYTLGQNMNRVRDQYANLGLGGSTMEAQDLAGQASANVAQGASLQQLAFQDALQQNALNAQIDAQNQSNIGFNVGAGSLGTLGA